ncbi:hypothetical protein O181_087578 [Austropuccinia psidii MF-1]|uniref:Uncharacterized protein n=1 Tax=Austropuccinia psidii MF-1 TaxID=1389203 RepID=A0A9Q3P1D2_9BASI|nr:hypothetical protein [Austropuccinia psidii MF-1]
MLMRMRLKQIHTDWPQVSAHKRVSVRSPADHPTKKLAGWKTGSKRSARHMKACGCPQMSGREKQAAPVVVCPDLGTRVNPPFAYDPNH